MPLDAPVTTVTVIARTSGWTNPTWRRPHALPKDSSPDGGTWPWQRSSPSILLYAQPVGRVPGGTAGGTCLHLQAKTGPFPGQQAGFPMCLLVGRGSFQAASTRDRSMGTPGPTDSNRELQSSHWGSIVIDCREPGQGRASGGRADSPARPPGFDRPARRDPPAGIRLTVRRNRARCRIGGLPVLDGRSRVTPPAEASEVTNPDPVRGTV